ncbi:hypothetical protein U9M48_038097 [Paspalum notatum var. saurae]|uniref:DUF8040 domain-containing protein n=1 Tax=Paspalum notatum var. saurae TaxID=547442 RepID=A0AAQ3UGA0_PASNO
MAGFGADGTRDVFSQPDPYSPDEGFDFYSDDAARTPVSRLGMEAVDGSSAFVPGQEEDEALYEDEAQENEEEELQGSENSPMSSSGHKKASSTSTRSSADSPIKKSKSPMLKVMKQYLHMSARQSAERNLFLKKLGSKQETAEAKLEDAIRKAQQLAKQPRLDEISPEFYAVSHICKDEALMKFFINMETSEGIGWSVDSSDEEPLTLLQEDAEHEKQVMETIFFFGMYHDTYMHKNKRRTAPESGQEWVMRNLADETECYKLFRMTSPMFYRLHDLLVQSYGLKSTSKSNSTEALGMFLWMVGASQSVRQVDNRLQRSPETVHRNFGKVLKCLVKLAADIIRPMDQNSRQYTDGCNVLDSGHTSMIV